MTIQSLSVVVPNKACINHCKFCVSRQHCDKSVNLLRESNADWDYFAKAWYNRLAFARDNNCNTVMLTGESEPQQNMEFLKFFSDMNSKLDSPFRSVEIQTTGVLLDKEYLRFLRDVVGVTTVSISVSAFDDDVNAEIVGMPAKAKVNLEQLCRNIKALNINLRLSVNLTNYFDRYTNAEDFFKEAKQRYGADQITLRVLYADGDTPEANWVRENSANPKTVARLLDYIYTHGTELGRLPYGRTKYSVYGMSTVVDDDCMSKEQTGENYKYLILRPNCHLYSRWDDEGSLIF